MGLEEMATELSDMLAESDEYRRYLSAKEELAKDAALMSRIDDYRKRNFYVQNSCGDNKIEEIKRLMGEYYDTLADKRVKEFLDSELILCRRIQGINNIIVDKLDFDVDFIA